MAKFKPDLRKFWRDGSARVQQENQDRLLGGQEVEGGAVAPDKVPAGPKGRKRIRYRGIRVKLADIAHNPGVEKGDLLRETTKRSNAKATRTGFSVGFGSGLNLVKARTLQAGKKGQAPRPVFGASAATVGDLADGAAREYRDQMCAHAQAELERERANGER